MDSRVPRKRLPEFDGSALSDYLKHAGNHDKMPTVIPREVVVLGWICSAISMIGGGLALLIPNAYNFGHGGFFLLLGTEATTVVTVMHVIAIPVMLIALFLAALTNYLRVTPASQQWRVAIPAQAVLGAGTGALGGIALFFIILNLIIWITLMMLLVLAVGIFVAGLFGGS